MRRCRLAPYLFLACLAGCFAFAQNPASSPSTSQATTAQPMVSGTLVYRERIALPPDAAIEVKVQDISSTPPKTIAESVFAPEGRQVPIPFQLPYTPADINQAHKYQVLANISVHGKPMFTTQTPLWVITQGAPSQVSILLQAAPEQPSAASGAKLRDTHWVLAEVAGKPAQPGQGESVHIELHKKGRFTGSTGCNRMSGNYIASEGALQFTLGPITMKACSEPVMQQEQAVLGALKSTTAYKISGNTLELMNGAESLAKFEAEGK